MTNASAYVEFIHKEFSKKKSKNPQYSLRAFANFLKIDPATLSQVISGKRVLSFNKATQLVEQLGMSPKDRQNFLWQLAKAHKQRNRHRLSLKARELLKNSQQTAADQLVTWETFNIIADWYHYAILELTYVEGFQNDAVWIAKRLGISKTEAKAAIHRLREVGLLKTRAQRMFKSSEQIRTDRSSETSTALKQRQVQIMEKSLFALENHSIDKRNHTAMTLSIDPSQIPEAKVRITKFMNELTEYLESGKRKKVYELTVNLFSLEKEEV